MAIVLDTEERLAKIIKTGSDTVEIAAGKFLKIETTPSGEELLNVEVPGGKTWTVTVTVHIEEC